MIKEILKALLWGLAFSIGACSGAILMGIIARNI